MALVDLRKHSRVRSRKDLAANHPHAPKPRQHATFGGPLNRVEGHGVGPGAVTRVEELVERLDELPRFSDLVAALTL